MPDGTEPLKLNISIEGGDEAVKMVQALEAAIKKISAPAQKASSAVKKLTGGPAQSYQDAYDNFVQSQKSGTHSQRFDAYYKLLAAQKRLSKAGASVTQDKKPSLGSRLAQAIGSTRIGANGAYPLINSIFRVFGTTGSYALAAGTALLKLSQEALEAGKAFATLKFVSGASQGEAGRLAAFGSFAGVNLGSASRSLNHELTTNGQAVAFGQRLGLRGNVGAYGNTDDATNLLKLIDEIRKQDKELGRPEAIRTLRILNQEGLQPLLDVSDELYGKLKRLGKEQAEAFRGFDKEVAEFQGEWTVFIEEMKLTLLPFLREAIKLATNLLKFINSDSQVEGGNAMLHTGGSRTQSTIDRHTRAMEDHSRALQAGTFGGGARARGAVPAAWTGINSGTWRGQAAALGAFAL